MKRYLLCALLFTLLALGTASAQPLLPQPRLAPESFRGSINLVQKLAFSRLDGKDAPERLIEVLLQIEPEQVRLAGFTLGMRILTLEWDGQKLQSWRHPRVPDFIDGERVLRDVQFTYWPSPAIRAMLPPGWDIIDVPRQRMLLLDGQTAMLIRYSQEPHWDARAELENYAEGYRLAIDSRPQPEIDSAGGNSP